MLFFADISEARRAIAAFLVDHAGGLPTELRDQVQEIASSASPVDQIANLAELLYARNADVGTAGQQLAGGLAAFAGDNGWHDLRDGRGRNIALAMMRDTGEEAPLGVVFPLPEDDPAPAGRYVAEPAPEA
jgi:hypothetical protein